MEAITLDRIMKIKMDELNVISRKILSRRHLSSGLEIMAKVKSDPVLLRNLSTGWMMLIEAIPRIIKKNCDTK